MSSWKKMIAKVKSIKNIEIYAAIVLAIVVVIVVWAGARQKNSAQTTSDLSYIDAMEHKICSVVEKIEGCGKAEVAISYSSNEESVYAYETHVTTSGGVTEQRSEIVTYKGEPLVTTVLPPKICGVVVVAEGASDPIVRMKIVEAVVTLLDVDVSDVQVFTYKS